jgi:hypothetical protein
MGTTNIASFHIAPRITANGQLLLIQGTVNVPYKRPRDTTGEIGGYIKGGLDLTLKVH